MTTERVFTNHARVACWSCGALVYTERIGARPVAFPRACPACGAADPSRGDALDVTEPDDDA